MSFDSASISNNILKRSFEEGVPITPLKLQKILFFTAAQYVKRSSGKEPLLNELFQPWQYGPVLPSVYAEFKSYGGKPIRRYAKDAEGKAYTITEDVDALKVTLDEVWAATRGLGATRLVAITHARDSAWWKAYQEESRYIKDEAILSDTTYVSLLGVEKVDL